MENQIFYALKTWTLEHTKYKLPRNAKAKKQKDVLRDTRYRVPGYYKGATSF